MESKIEYENILKNLYNSREEKIDEIIKNLEKNIKSEIKEVSLEELIDRKDDIEGLKKIYYKIQDNHEIKISKYCEAIYEQGIKDGVNFMIDCIKK